MKPKAFRFLGFRLPIGLQIAAFADFGSAWNQRDEFNRNFIRGFGLGLRFITPTTGMARIDFGFGQEGFSIRIHLGSYEKPVMQRQRVR
jgi:outer membrane translocation and assembly module TamA